MSNYKNTPPPTLPRDVFVLGLTGVSGAGKDLFASFFLDEARTYQYAHSNNYDTVDFRRFSLADELKHIGISYFGMSKTDCFTQEGKAAPHRYINGKDGSPKTNREVLQQISTAVHEIDPFVLCRQLDDYCRYEREKGRKMFMVIPDVSLPQQGDYCRANGELWRIRREEVESGSYTHDTEHFRRYGDVDREIDNNGSTFDLQESAEHYVQIMLDKIAPDPDAIRTTNS